jgi:hypothetical protein
LTRHILTPRRLKYYSLKYSQHYVTKELGELARRDKEIENHPIRYFDNPAGTTVICENELQEMMDEYRRVGIINAAKERKERIT